MFIASIAETWKQSKCPLTNEWINKIWYKHTMEYYSSLKREEILTHAKTWMNFEDIMLSEVSQTEKDEYHMNSLTCDT